jgi:2-polyprenyl-6-methoxyphenol hydroxylase-like FAD-dependent oxidoreductase
MDFDADFIVVGAGPVGLCTALGLARANASVVVIDADEQLNDSPRAMTYTDPTLRLFERLGLIEAAEEVGLRNQFLNFVWPAHDLVVKIDFHKAEPDRKYPYNLHFGQEALGEIAMKAFLEHPRTDVRFGHTLVGIEQGADSAVVRCELADGSHRDLKARWVIGCDGARSTVRKLLDLEFEGFTWPERFVATNVYYDFQKHGWENVHMICDGQQWGLVARINHSPLHRVTFPEDASLSNDELRAKIPEHYKRIMPTDDPYELVSWAPYRVHERSCPTYNVGRVVLAGDAAHVCNPCGGRGLTGGIMDVDRLLDAFEGILGGTRGEDDLDGYTKDRRTEFLEVSSPFASTMKRMWEREDHEEQKKDQEQVMKISVGSGDISLAGLRPGGVHGTQAA